MFNIPVRLNNFLTSGGFRDFGLYHVLYRTEGGHNERTNFEEGETLPANPSESSVGFSQAPRGSGKCYWFAALLTVPDLLPVLVSSNKPFVLLQ